MKYIDTPFASVAELAAAAPPAQKRIFGAANIKRHLQKKKPDHSRGAETSPAGQPHAEDRAAARRRRQMERAK